MLGPLSNQAFKEFLEVFSFLVGLGCVVYSWLKQEFPTNTLVIRVEAVCRNICRSFQARVRRSSSVTTPRDRVESVTELASPDGDTLIDPRQRERSDSSVECTLQTATREIAVSMTKESKEEGFANAKTVEKANVAYSRTNMFRKSLKLTVALVVAAYFWVFIAVMVWVSVFHEWRACPPHGRDMPALNLRRHPNGNGPYQITVSGESAGADEAVIFHFAHSEIVVGACGIQAQPYRCAVTRFEKDELANFSTNCRKEYECAYPYTDGYDVPVCLGPPDRPGCPPNMTLTYDKCKFHPDRVNVTDLANVVRATSVCRPGSNGSHPCIDSPRNLQNARAYLLRGLMDVTYRNGSARNTADVYSRFMHVPDKQIWLRNDIDIGHAAPRLWMCRGLRWIDGRLLDEEFGFMNQSCGGPPTDSSEECLSWLFKPEHDLQQPIRWRQWYQVDMPFDGFSQYHLFVRVYGPDYYLFVPRACRLGAKCRLHVHLSGCHDFPKNPSPLAIKDSRAMVDTYHVWAVTNNVVVAYPINPANPKLGTPQEHWGEVGEKHCWDAYGETGADYATQAGLHVRQIRSVVADVYREWNN